MRRYNKEIFPLYSSFKGGADGKLVNADKRQNIWTNSWLWIKLGVALVVALFSIRNVWNYLHPVDKNPAPQAASSGSPPGIVPAVLAPALPSFSPEWRVVGMLQVGDKSQVLLADSSGRIRGESPSLFQLDGLARVGRVDGQRVSTYSGVPSKSSAFGLSSSVPLSAPPVQGSEGVKK